MRDYARAVVLAIFLAAAVVSLKAAIINWPSACNYSDHPIWQWIWDCPDVPSGGGGGGGW